MIKLKDILNEKFEMGDNEKRQLKTAIKAFNNKKTEFFGNNSSIMIIAKVLKRNKFPGTAKELTDALDKLQKAVENVEAQQLSQDAVNKAAKEIGNAQQRAVSIFTSDLKNNKYDNMDLSKAITTGNIKNASYSKREVLSALYYDLRDRFKAYSRRKKN